MLAPELQEFLAVQGLERYADKLAENDVDFATLLALDEDHLKELGLSLGHRVKLLKAIAALREPAAIAGETIAAAGAPRDDRSSEPGAERRQITVLFCDMWARRNWPRVDPEDMRDIIGPTRTSAPA